MQNFVSRATGLVNWEHQFALNYQKFDDQDNTKIYDWKCF